MAEITNKSYYSIIPANVRYDKELTANAKLLYGEITALTNEKGFCWATNGYFAELYNVSRRTIILWINQLTAKGFIRSELVYKEGTKEVLQRKIFISLSHEENYTTPRKKLHDPSVSNFTTPSEVNYTTPSEENFTDNNTVINNTFINNTVNTTKDKKIKTPSSKLEKEFEEIWAIYPRKISKKLALASYIKARKKENVTYETIKNGVEMYVKYINYHRLDDRKIKHGSTWFNQECWNDVYETNAFQKKQQFSAFTEMMLDDMENPDAFLNLLGVDGYEERGNQRIVVATEG